MVRSKPTNIHQSTIKSIINKQKEYGMTLTLPSTKLTTDKLEHYSGNEKRPSIFASMIYT